MALYTFLHPKCTIRSFLPLTCSFFSSISSTSFSSLRRNHRFPPPPEASLPPVPKKVPFKASAHGKSWQDPYHWMSNTKDPDLSEYLNRENLYAEAFMADTHNLQRALFSEMISRMPTKISTPPERFGPWFAHFPPTLFQLLANLRSFFYILCLDCPCFDISQF